MGIFRGPGVVNDGLVFGYDTGYPISDNNTTTRFNQGEPVTNLWDSMLNTQSLRTHTKHYWNGIKWTEDSTYTHPGVNGPKGTYLGLVFKHVSGAINSSWSGNSYGYMLRDIACTNGAAMAMSCWVYASVDCDVTAIPAVIEGESGGETTISGYPALYDLNNKGTWQVLAKKANSDGNVRFIPLYPYKTGVTNGSFAGFFMWALPQVAYGDHVVPPIQPGATRSDTASLIDLKRTTSFDVSNVSFDSNAQLEFDGTNDYLLTGDNVTITGDQSIETLIKFDSLQGFLQGLVSNHDYVNTSNFGINQVQTNKIGISIGYTNGSREYNNKYSTAAVVTGKYYHIVMTFNLSANQCKLYIDGELDSTFNLSNTVKYTSRPMVAGRWDYQYGNYYFHGNIEVARYYNKTLSLGEVEQNYKAYKNRFNI